MSNSNLKSDPKSVKLDDVGSVNINPATEDKQDDIISELKGESYDTVEVDKSAYPIITLTKKLSGSTISTKTVNIIG